MSAEESLRARLSELIEKRDHLDKLIEETRANLAKHERARERRERVDAKKRESLAAMSEDERARAWLMDQPGVGPRIADSILDAAGGAAKLWDVIHGLKPRDYLVPYGVRVKLTEAETPPWNEVWW